MGANENRFQGLNDRNETERLLTSFLAAQAADPAGQFLGDVNDGWVKVRRNRSRWFGFDYRGQITESDGNCYVELLITPTPVTAIALLLIAIPVFLGFVFAAMFGWGFGEGSALVRAILVSLMLIIGGLAMLALLEPRKTRRQLLNRLKEAGIARSCEAGAPSGANPNRPRPRGRSAFRREFRSMK